MNGWALRLFASAYACEIVGNTFSGNTFDVSTNGDLKNNVLKGNYWDRYSGYDLDRDGYGDVPHRPLGFFTLLVERMPYAMVLSRSLFVSLLDRAERLLPSLGPEALKDEHPLMRPAGRKVIAGSSSKFDILHSTFFIQPCSRRNEKWKMMNEKCRMSCPQAPAHHA